MKKFVAYCRVSTIGQDIGLDAQERIINEWVCANNGIILDTIREKESGKSTANRSGLAQAIDICMTEGASLIVAKLDRLSRDVADVFNIKKRLGDKLTICDLNAADTMLLGVFASLAQKEREMISRRTKEGLKAKYNKPGQSWHDTHNAEATGQRIRENNAKGVRARRDNAKNAPENKTAWMVIRLMDGSLQSKADFLNENGYRTRNGKRWTAAGVSRLIARFKTA